MGLPGPDAGKGGKHLILPPGYKGEVPAGYFVGKALSNKVFAGARSLPVNGDAKGALEALRAIKVYPLVTADNPKLLTFVDLTDKPMDATCLRWEDNIQYWQKLHEVIDAEPIVEKFLPMYGLLAALGIEKGKPFAPDARTKAILEKAAKAGRDQMLVSAFASERPDRFMWQDRKWEWAGLVPNTAQFETAKAWTWRHATAGSPRPLSRRRPCSTARLGLARSTGSATATPPAPSWMAARFTN